jgi:predicted HTH transcriptional regulator
MRDEPSISKKSISEKTGISVRTISRIISELKQRKIIERKGSDKNGIWVVNK